MLILNSKTSDDNIAVIALDENDSFTLEFFYNKSIVFGFYKFEKLTEKDKIAYAKLLKLYPTAKSVGYINVNSNFIPKINMDLFNGKIHNNNAE